MILIDDTVKFEHRSELENILNVLESTDETNEDVERLKDLLESLMIGW